ncbi:hypothetical protein FXO38_27519 [Capsicum annuum]|nr:hypothetical protein FXO38_27519 [Capsicum annuum]KAF3676217.1 hypothetical protein FXO37_05439 [Capsicum annuum]
MRRNSGWVGVSGLMSSYGVKGYLQDGGRMSGVKKMENGRLLPPCPFDVAQGFRRNIDGVGFGFDPVVNDNKVIRNPEIYNDPPYMDQYSRELKVEVYDMSIDLRRELENVDKELPKIYWAPCLLEFTRVVVIGLKLHQNAK